MRRSARISFTFRHLKKQTVLSKPYELKMDADACRKPTRRASSDDLMLLDLQRIQDHHGHFHAKNIRTLAQIDQAVSVLSSSQQQGNSFVRAEGLSEDDIALTLHQRTIELIKLRMRILDTRKINLSTTHQHAASELVLKSVEGKPRKGCLRQTRSWTVFKEPDCRWASSKASSPITSPSMRKSRDCLQPSVTIDESRNVTKFYHDDGPSYRPPAGSSLNTSSRHCLTQRSRSEYHISESKTKAQLGHRATRIPKLTQDSRWIA